MAGFLIMTFSVLASNVKHVVVSKKIIKSTQSYCEVEIITSETVGDETFTTTVVGTGKTCAQAEANAREIQAR